MEDEELDQDEFELRKNKSGGGGHRRGRGGRQVQQAKQAK
jgi:hypothetical protein